MRKRSPGLRALILIGLTVLLGLAVADRLVRMDPRFFDHSAPGMRALAHYLAGDYGGAARWYRRSHAAAVPGLPTSSWVALQAGDYALAEALARRESTGAPGDLDTVLTLAEVALARGQHAEALQHAGQVLRAQPEDYDALLISMVVRARRREWDGALDLLKQALRQSRAERRYTVFLSALEVTGDLDDLETPPLCLLAHLHRYLRIYDPARADTAMRYAHRAIEAGDRADDGWVTLAIVHDKQGKRRRALEEFDLAIKVNPSNTTALLGAARLHSDRGELATEYRLVSAAFRAAPDDPFVGDWLHFTLTTKLGDYRQALAVEQAILATRPSDPKAWWRLGEVQLSLGEHEAALQSFDRSTQLGALPEAHEGRGIALHELQRNADAVAAYERAIAIDPSRPVAYLGLAVLYAEKRRYREALAAYERAYLLGARQVEQVVELCILYHETGQVFRARDCLQDVLTRDPDNVRGRALLEHVNAAVKRRPA